MKDIILNRHWIPLEEIEVLKHRNDLKIVEAYGGYQDASSYKLQGNDYIWSEDMLEAIEEPKTFGQEMDDLMSTIIDEIRNNPTGVVAKLGEITTDKNKEIEYLKIKNRKLQSRIDYLEGQISVYKSFMINESEEN